MMKEDDTGAKAQAVRDLMLTGTVAWLSLLAREYARTVVGLFEELEQNTTDLRRVDFEVSSG